MRQSSAGRGVFCNRTLNLRSIRAIGYDLDYTLAHYNVDDWELRAYEHTRDRLRERSWPVEGLAFDPTQVIRGLALDLELGNLVKATRFGYPIRAAHGTRFLDFEDLRRTYQGTVIDFADPRFVFLDTLFSMSEAHLFAQLVEHVDDASVPGVRDYGDLFRAIRASLDEAHTEGELKTDVLSDPDRFIVPDPELVPTLLDQRHSGKRLLLITNSDWDYASRIMSLLVDPYLTEGSTWRDLFDTIIVSARKPDFFLGADPLFRVVDEGLALLRPHHGPIEAGGVYYGGNAGLVEESLGVTGDEILYVGDHVYSDVHVSKAVRRWRTGLILRELESEVEALDAFRPAEEELTRLMLAKEHDEQRLADLRLARQRRNGNYAPAGDEGPDLEGEMDRLKAALAARDEAIAPLARMAGTLRNAAWGPLMRAGIDKSLFARQVESYADVYTSRVSNFLAVTPFGFLRASRSSLPHDPV